MGIFARITERMDRQSHLMGAMMKRLDVDFAAIGTEAEGARLQSAARMCLMCQDGEECRHWLESHAEGDVDAAPDFCPNKLLFADYRR